MRGNVPPGRRWGGRWGSGRREGVLLEGPGHFFLPCPPLCSPGQRVTVASLPFAACDTLGQRQRQRQGRGAAPQLILSSPQPAAERKHGHGGRVELPHLLRCSK